MKQTVEEAAREYRDFMVKDNGGSQYDFVSGDIKDAFLAGAEWQSKQSPWTLVGDRSNPMPNNKPCLLLLEDGSVVDDSSDWEERYLMVVAWMPKPTFDQILEANKDVLQRMKEKGD